MQYDNEISLQKKKKRRKSTRPSLEISEILYYNLLVYILPFSIPTGIYCTTNRLICGGLCVVIYGYMFVQKK